MEKNIKKYISNVKNVNILLENINKDIELLNKKLDLLKEVNNLRLDNKTELLENILKNKVQIGGSGVSENLKMNDELDIKIKNLQDKVNEIRKKTSTLQAITKENLQKTKDNINNLVQLTESVDSIMGDPVVTERISQNIKKFTSDDYIAFSQNIPKKKTQVPKLEDMTNILDDPRVKEID